MDAAPTPDAAAAVGLRLDGEMTIVQAQALRECLAAAAAEAAAAGAPLALDLSSVEGFDSAGVQLLLAARATLAAAGQRLRVDAAAAPVLAALDVYGLRAALIDGGGGDAGAAASHPQPAEVD